MTEGLKGAIIGGAIGIFGSVVVETIRAHYQKKENSRNHKFEIYEKRKATYFIIIDHFRRFQVEMINWKSKPKKDVGLKSAWDSLTGYIPHLIGLPSSVFKFIAERVKDLNDWLFMGGLTHFDALPSDEIYNKILDAIDQIFECLRTDIAKMDSEIIDSAGWFKMRIEKIKKKFNKKPKKGGS